MTKNITSCKQQDEKNKKKALFTGGKPQEEQDTGLSHHKTNGLQHKKLGSDQANELK
jgi:hypothetical protein